ncbi:MAG: chemotaxis-specific protein-glutamate methyltransferase CheB [Rhizobacter sp.]
MTTRSGIVRVLVVDDSAASRELLLGLLAADARVQVVGVAADGEAAVAAAERLRPDVITMDIHLPRLDGYAATRRIMESCPTRIVMVTSSSLPDDVAASFRALESGALAVLAKPPGPGHRDFAAARDELVRTVTLMAEVHVVRRWPARSSAHPPALAAPPAARRELTVVAIGASTGGPLVLQAILSRLAPAFPAPVLVVQHISSGFASGLAQWLAEGSGRPVCVAAHGDVPQAGMVYVAPDGAHLQWRGDGRVELVDAPPSRGFRPSIDALFESLARHAGRRAAGILLTGMGVDGAAGLKAMRSAGALTIVQDRESAVIHGMPAEALRVGAAMHVLPPEGIADMLGRVVNMQKG